MTNQRGSLVLYLAAIILIVVVSGAAFFMWQRTQTTTPNQTAETPGTVQTSPTAMPSSSSDSADVNVEDEFKSIDVDLEAL